MAFGIDRENQKPGDVLISSAIIPYDNREVKDDGQGSYSTSYSRASRQLARPALVELFRQEQHRKTSREYNIFEGAILSGAARIHSAAFRDELIRSVPEGGAPIVGGEMEGVGLLGVVISGDPNSAWCVVKGISDFADDQRHTEIESNRPIACKNAAEFVLSALENDTQDEFDFPKR